MDPPPREPERQLLSLPVGYPRTGRDGSRRLQLLCSRRKKYEARGVQRRLGSGSSGETDRMTMSLDAAPVFLQSAPRDRLPARIPPGLSRFLIWSASQIFNLAMSDLRCVNQLPRHAPPEDSAAQRPSLISAGRRGIFQSCRTARAD